MPKLNVECLQTTWKIDLKQLKTILILAHTSHLNVNDILIEEAAHLHAENVTEKVDVRSTISDFQNKM